MSYRSRFVSRKRSMINLSIDHSRAEVTLLCVLNRCILSLPPFPSTGYPSCSTRSAPARLPYRARTPYIYTFDISYSVICDTNTEPGSSIWIMIPIRWSSLLTSDSSSRTGSHPNLRCGVEKSIGLESHMHRPELGEGSVSDKSETGSMSCTTLRANIAKLCDDQAIGRPL
jgi:hypothetical protein